ncbi:hypothetical protein [Nonomuraea rhodomycinica]|uniref:FtsX-like permease family protein n=1 Tax=Nonomuraea rhodomycinica TaxID=1712872 RepID=A0A7Y6INL0_9ACTN|nr:hypothetical protein [Nonomuraea rhodomycinica]NUW40209.1 hypothetical protein [Nonomuraea rhodomycinica]
MIDELETLFRIALGMVVPVAFAAAAMTLATSSAPPDRHVRVRRGYVVWGWSLALVGVCMMVLGAWAAREGGRYGAFEALVTVLMALVGAGLLLLGLGALASWLLEVLARPAERLPLPVRLAARDLADRRETTAVAVTVTATATALAIAVTVVAVGMTGQGSAQYVPRARPGALLVGYFPAERLGAVRAAVQRELPGVPVTQTETLSGSLFGDQNFTARADNVDLSDEGVHRPQVIGDETLLRYLTGDQATPYDDDTAVVVTRTSEDERARLDSRLGDLADTYVERGYQPLVGWRVLAAALLLLALGGALATGIGAARRARPGQVLRRAGAGSVASRGFGASRAGLSALCGAVPGALAGCAIGMLLIWPLTMSTTWEDPPRVLPFETPRTAVAAVAAGLPVVAAALGGLLVRERAAVARHYSRRSSPAGR